MGILDQSVEDVSRALNAQLISYKNKIDILRSLIEKGQLDKMYLQVLDDSLFKKMKELRIALKIEIPLEIISLEVSEADSLILKFTELVPVMKKNFFSYFENEMIRLFTPNEPNSLIRIKSHLNNDGKFFSEDDKSYSDFIEHYVENYLNLLQSKSISWNNKLVVDYMKILENQTYVPNLKFQECINSVVRESICSQVLIHQELILNKVTRDRVERAIKFVLNDLVEIRTPDFEELIRVRKKFFMEKISELFKKTILEHPINVLIKNKTEKEIILFEKIKTNIQELNNYRINLDNLLVENKLYSLGSISEVLNLLSSLQKEKNPLKLDLEFENLFETTNSHLSKFIENRNEFGSKIEYLFMSENYKELIQKVNEIESSDNFNLTIVKSLESLIFELQVVYKKVLSVKFYEFHGNEIPTIYKEYIKKTSNLCE